MKQIYSFTLVSLRACLVFGALVITFNSKGQSPTTVSGGACDAVVANFNTNDNGFNSPSIYSGNLFDSSFYYNATRGYWTDYLPPTRVNPPGAPRVLSIISPPLVNPNPTGTFNVGFYYIVPNPLADRFQVRIVSVTQTSMGTVTNVEATTGPQLFSTWSTPTAYVDGETPAFNGFSGTVCIRLVDPDIINNPNTTFRVEVTYVINETFFVAFDDLSVGPAQSPLPVNFIGIVAKRNNDAVDLKWDVSEEIDVKEYEIERSTNGSTFTTVGSVSTKGKSIYAFTNYNAPTGPVFYRVKSVDIDGASKYSGIIRLKGDAANSYSSKLSLYPSLATDQVTVEHKKLGTNARITIATTDGRVLKVIVPTNGSSHTLFDVSSFRPGVYILRLDDGEGNMETAKFVRQ